MYATILWLFIIILTIILIKLLNIRVNVLICIGISILIVLFAANINISIEAAIEGSKLWYKAILPTTFPFVVICNLLIYYDGINLYSRILGPLICKPLNLSENCSFPIVASLLCGYPLGAKYCVDLYNMNYLDKDEYVRLLNIASNVGPIFLIGSVATALLNNMFLGYILLFSNYLSIIFIGVITKKKRGSSKISSLCLSKKMDFNFGIAIKNSIENAITTTLSIGGFIIIFSVVIALVKNSHQTHAFFSFIEVFCNIPLDTIYASFLGSIEITNGCSILSKLNLQLPLKISIISFLCSFSGLAIITQTSSFVSSTNINYSRYILLKLIQGIFSFIITFILMTFLPTTVYSSAIKINAQLNILYLFTPILLLLVLTCILKITNKLFLHTS
ncbi:MAG: sporulation integral membrane protein YlbJ [Clostridium butyricum]|nr:sporulation integral membrane protein YlbJ [Clostridium butyricum]